MSIKAHEIHHGREYIVEEHRGNGIAVGALSTAIPAAAITLANFAKEWLGNKGKSCDAGSIAGLVAAIAPAIAAMRGTNDVNGNTVISALEAKVAKLEAEKYTDGQVAKLYEANLQNMKDQFAYTLEIEKKQAGLECKVNCMEQRLTDYEISQREREGLKEQIVDGKIARVVDQVGCVAGKLDLTNQALNITNARIDAITEVVVPGSVVCKRNNGCSNGVQ